MNEINPGLMVIFGIFLVITGILSGGLSLLIFIPLGIAYIYYSNKE